MNSEYFPSDEADEVLEEFVLMWRPNVLLPNEGQGDPNFIPTTSGSWRPRTIKAVIERQEINLTGRDGDEEVRSISGQLIVRKVDAVGTLRLQCQIGAIENASIFAIDEKYPVRFANPDSLPNGEVLTVQRLAQLSGSKDLRTVALSGLQKENPNHLVQFVFGNMGMRLVTGDGRANYFAFRNPQICDRWVTSLREVIRTQLELETFVAPTNDLRAFPDSATTRNLDIRSHVNSFLADLEGATSRAAKTSVGPPSSGYLTINREGRPSKWFVRIDSSVDQRNPEKTMDRPQLVHFMKVGKTILQIPTNALRRSLPVSLLDAETIDAKKLAVVVDKPFSKEFFLDLTDADGESHRMEAVATSLENRLQWEDWFCRFGARKVTPAPPPESVNPDEAFEHAHNISFKRHRSLLSPGRRSPASVREGSASSIPNETPLGLSVAQAHSMSDLTTPQLSLRKIQSHSERNLPDDRAPVQIVVTSDDRMEELDLPSCMNVESFHYLRRGEDSPSSSSDDRHRDVLEATLSNTEFESGCRPLLTSDPATVPEEVNTASNSAGRSESFGVAFVVAQPGALQNRSIGVDSAPSIRSGTDEVEEKTASSPGGSNARDEQPPAIAYKKDAAGIDKRIVEKSDSAISSPPLEAKSLAPGEGRRSVGVRAARSVEVRRAVQTAIRMRVTEERQQEREASGNPNESHTTAIQSTLQISSAPIPAGSSASNDNASVNEGERRDYTWKPTFGSTISWPQEVPRTTDAGRSANVDCSAAQTKREFLLLATSNAKSEQQQAAQNGHAQETTNPSSSSQSDTCPRTEASIIPNPATQDEKSPSLPAPPHALDASELPSTPQPTRRDAATTSTSSLPSGGAKSPFFSDLRMNSEAFRYDLSPCFHSPPSASKGKSSVELFRDSIVTLKRVADEDSSRQMSSIDLSLQQQQPAGEICAICKNDKLLVSICTVTGKVHQLLSQCRLLRRSAFPRLEDPPEVKQARKVLGF